MFKVIKENKETLHFNTEAEMNQYTSNNTDWLLAGNADMEAEVDGLIENE